MPGNPKQYNTHKYPNATRQPRHLDGLRKSEARKRQEAYDKLSLEEKIARLPAEPHAAKQRARLQSLLDKKNQKVENEKIVADKAETAEPAKQNKKSKKGQS